MGRRNNGGANIPANVNPNADGKDSGVAAVVAGANGFEGGPSGGTGGTDGGKDGAGPASNGADGVTRDIPPDVAARLSDPASVAGVAAPKRRGRPPGSTNSPKPGPERAPEPLDRIRLEGTILFLNNLVVASMKLPPSIAMVMTMKPEEAKTLAKAYGDLAAEYNLAPSRKVMVWVTAIAATGNFYGPRFMLMAQVTKAMKDHQQTAANKVVGMDGRPLSEMTQAGDTSGKGAGEFQELKDWPK